MKKTLYLANPYGFSAALRAGPLAELTAALEALGAEVWEPFGRNERVDMAAPDWAWRVARRNMREADGLFAVVNGCPPDEGDQDAGPRGPRSAAISSVRAILPLESGPPAKRNRNQDSHRGRPARPGAPGGARRANSRASRLLIRTYASCSPRTARTLTVRARRTARR